MPRLLLAPMEGLADYLLRDVLTRVAGPAAEASYDSVVSEFVSVSASLLPRRVYARRCPEILQGARTPSGTPMVIQLMGSDPHWLARNAALAAQFSPYGIDLNFGCPAPQVNRHGGGAALLDRPEHLHAIVSAVRAAVPAAIPVTAKMRLGVRDTRLALDCARALADAGAAQLVVHARTRQQAYKPPAYWEWVARIREVVAVPVVANGEVWSVADWQRCRQQSGCEDVMLGRGAVADPWLALRIRGLHAAEASSAEWPQVMALLRSYWVELLGVRSATSAPGRLKLWLGYLARTWPQAAALRERIRVLQDVEAVSRQLAGE